MKKKYIIAIDLHGTLLDADWKIEKELLDELIVLIETMSSDANFYVCTGNDYSFVQKYIPTEVLNLLSGYVLESGCIVHNHSQKIFVTNQILMDKLKELEEYLKSKEYPFIKSFAKRESTISMFTCDESGGEEPVRFYDIVNEGFQAHKYAHLFYLTYSNVAFDIIPLNVSKWTALMNIAEGNCLISFMDSYNDKEIALYSDITFLPANTSPSLVEYLRSSGRLILPISRFHLRKYLKYISQLPATRAVIEGLYIVKNEIIGKGLNCAREEEAT